MEDIELKYIENSKDYYIGSDGYVYHKIGIDFKRLNGWLNLRKNGNEYRRTWILFIDKLKQQIYNHYLVAVAFHGGDKRSEGLIVRHGEYGSLNNTKDNIRWGSHYQNMNTDRRRDGNYNNRGGKTETVTSKELVDDLPF